MLLIAPLCVVQASFDADRASRNGFEVSDGNRRCEPNGLGPKLLVSQESLASYKTQTSSHAILHHWLSYILRHGGLNVAYILLAGSGVMSWKIRNVSACIEFGAVPEAFVDVHDYLHSHSSDVRLWLVAFLSVVISNFVIIRFHVFRVFIRLIQVRALRSDGSGIAH
jgi:hypothetical protein